MKHTPMKCTAYGLCLSGLLILTACSKTETPDASGTFEAVETIVSSESAGKLIQFTIQEGDELKGSELVAVIDSTTAYLTKLQIQQSQKAILSGRPQIEAQLESLRQELVSAEADEKRIKNLLTDGVASPKQADDARTRVEILQSRIEALKSSLQTSTSSLNEQAATLDLQLRQAEAQLKKCYVINPVKGVVLAKYAEVNEITAPGKALYKIADISYLILRAYVSGDQLHTLSTGKTVRVRTDNGQGGFKETEGKVEWISEKAEFTPKTIQTKNERANLVYAVKIRVKNDGTLKIGMYAEISI